MSGAAAGVRVGIVGCGLMGRKRALALDGDELIACCDADPVRAGALAGDFGAEVVEDIEALVAAGPDVVIVAVPHEQLAPLACRVLEAGAHVLVEKPAGIGVAQMDDIKAAAQRAGRVVKVGFNHRFHPAIARLAAEARSGRFGAPMFLRARYGHGGRVGYEREWRARFDTAGGGELVDQGMHLLDLSHWIMGPLPLHSALLRTNFWAVEVEDNAALLLGEPGRRDAPWSMLHVSWTEWKNMFSLELYCATGKLQVDGLAGSYGPQSLRIYAMSPELGPPELEQIDYPPEDVSWRQEWRAVRAAVRGEGQQAGDLDAARYAWARVQDAYAGSPYTPAGAPA